MKSQLRMFLFALVLPACSGDREPPATGSPSSWSELVPKLEPSASSSMVGARDAPVPAAPVPAPVAAVPVETSAPPTSYAEALAQGRALAAKGEHALAHDLFVAAIKFDRKQAAPHIELARLYIATGERGKSVAEANKAVKLAPDSSLAWNTKGRAELNRFGYDAAIEAFSKAAELDPDNVWAWNNLGYTELLLKQYDEAAEHLGEATSRKGATALMWNNLGTALEQLDRLDEAREAYDKGGTLGSSQALASRKRLEGVKSVALAKVDTSSDVAMPSTTETEDHTYSRTEDDEAGDADGPPAEVDGAPSASGDDGASPDDDDEDGSDASAHATM